MLKSHQMRMRQRERCIINHLFDQVMPESGGQPDNQMKRPFKLHTEDADTCLIKEVLYPLICATDSAIWTRDSLSGPPTFKSNFICLPSRTSTTNFTMIRPDQMLKRRGKQAVRNIRKYNANKEISSYQVQKSYAFLLHFHHILVNWSCFNEQLVLTPFSFTK